MSNWAQSMHAMLNGLLRKSKGSGKTKRLRQGKVQLSDEQKRIIARVDKAQMISSSPHEEDK